MKEASDTKSTSKKAASSKPTAGGDNLCGGNANCDSTSVKDGTKKSGSKKGDEWVIDSTAHGNSDPLANTWGNTKDALGGDDKNGSTKNLTAKEWPAASGTADAPIITNTEDKQAGGDNPYGFTREQDEELLKWKAENGSKSWADFARDIGKQVFQCKKRFNQIKPKDWEPNASNQGGGGNGGEGKKEKIKEKEQNHNQNQGNGGNKKDEKKDGNKEEEKRGEKKEESDPVNLWKALDGIGFTDDTNDDKKDDAGRANNSYNSGSNDATETWGNKVEDGGTTGAGGFGRSKDAGTGFDPGDWWGPTAAVGVATTNRDTINNQSSNNAGGISQGSDNRASLATIKPTSRPSSDKAPSKSHSQHKASNDNNIQSTTVRPLELEVKPDDTFSADDLRLIARILQQDCSMVWNRVSWRFRDKTGRTLHPDEFEKKITGRLEVKDSEKGERRR
jgi:hypothetical protein